MPKKIMRTFFVVITIPELALYRGDKYRAKMLSENRQIKVIDDIFGDIISKFTAKMFNDNTSAKNPFFCPNIIIHILIFSISYIFLTI